MNSRIKQNIRNLVVIIIAIFLTCFEEAFSSVVVTEQGVRPVNPGDVAMTFYSTVSNEGPGTYIVRLDMIKCCLSLPQNASECNAMRLHSGLAVILHPKNSHNISMYFNNHDLSGREGECTFRLLSWMAKDVSGNTQSQPESKKEIKISFNQGFEPSNFLRKLYIRLVGGSEGYSICENPDQDPRECDKGNCVMRYSGFRSVFNQTTKLCEITPSCSKSETFMISPITGKCRAIFSQRKIHGSMIPEMKSAEAGVGLELELEKAAIISSRNANKTNKRVARNHEDHTALLSPTAPKVSCVHGTPEGIGCKCDEGWTSQTPEATGGSKSSFDMCDILTPEGEEIEKSNKRRNSQIVLGVLLSLLVSFLIIGFILWWRRTKKFFYQKLPKAIQDEPSDDIISEIAGRREIVIPSGRITSNSPQNFQSSSPPGNTAYMPQVDIKPNNKTAPSEDEKIPRIIDSSSQQLNRQKSLNSIHTEIQSELKKAFDNKKSTLHKWATKRPESNYKISSESSEDFLHLGSKPFPWISSQTDHFNRDDMLSLTIHEKQISQSATILKPSPSQEAINFSRDCLVDLSKNSLAHNSDKKSIENLSSDDSKNKPEYTELTLPNEIALDLSLQQKIEERDKFLKACQNNKISRMRSLCTMEEFTKNGQCNNLASKAQSMPAMSVGPFINSQTEAQSVYSTDELHPSPMWTPPFLISSHPSSSKVVSHSTSCSKMSLAIGDLMEMNEAYSVLSRFDGKEAANVVNSPKTSKTSVWSNVASENAFEPDMALMCSRTSSEEDFIANFSDNLPTIQEEIISEEMISGEKMKDENLELKASNIAKPKESTKKSTAEEIELAAKLKGFVNNDKLKSSEIFMESDIFPSEVFINSKVVSPSSSSETSKSDTDVVPAALNASKPKSSKSKTIFWAGNVIQDG